MIESLRNSPAGLDPALEKSLAFGAAFHHAGNHYKLALAENH